MEASDGIAASSDERGEGSEEEFEALDIIAEFNGQYRIKWADIEEETGLPCVTETWMFPHQKGFPNTLLQAWKTQQAHQGSTEASTSKLNSINSVIPLTLHSSNVHSSPIPTGPRINREAVLFTSTRQNGNRNNDARIGEKQDRGLAIPSPTAAIPTGPRNPHTPRDRGPRWASTAVRTVQNSPEKRHLRSPERSLAVGSVDARDIREGARYEKSDQGLKPALDIRRSSRNSYRPALESDSPSSVRNIASPTQLVNSPVAQHYSPSSRSTYIPSPSNRRLRSLSPHRDSPVRRRSRSRSITPSRPRYRVMSRSPPRNYQGRERERRRSPSPIYYHDRSRDNYQPRPRSRSRSGSRSRYSRRSRSPTTRRRSRSPYIGRPYIQTLKSPSPPYASYSHHISPGRITDDSRITNYETRREFSSSHASGIDVTGSTTFSIPMTAEDLSSNMQTSLHSTQTSTQSPSRPEKFNSEIIDRELVGNKIDSCTEEKDVKPDLKKSIRNIQNSLSLPEIDNDNSISPVKVIKSESSPSTFFSSLPLDTSLCFSSYSQEPEPPSQSIPPPSPPPPPPPQSRPVRTDVTPPRLSSNATQYKYRSSTTIV